MRIFSVMELSTAHVTRETAKRLNDEDSFPIVTFNKGEYGWWVHVNEEYILDEELVLEIPEELVNILKYAVNLNCEWIMFDCDGEVCPLFPTFEW